MKPVLSEVRRARPLLGTFVEITADGREESKLHEAINRGFAAVTQVHRLMNRHDPLSEIGFLNATGACKSIRVHPWTAFVLRAAKKFSRHSKGLFDITASATDGQQTEAGDWRDITFVSTDRVRLRCPLTIDLGGIAKGFAVDRAVDALIAAGVSSGMVNAGGDLRVFGPKARDVHLRHPTYPELFVHTVRLHERSLATSALYYSRRAGNTASPYLNGRTRCPISHETSVSVHAANCMTADALTKVAFAMGEKATPLLNQHGAGLCLLWPESSSREFQTWKICHTR